MYDLIHAGLPWLKGFELSRADSCLFRRVLGAGSGHHRGVHRRPTCGRHYIARQERCAEGRSAARGNILSKAYGLQGCRCRLDKASTLQGRRWSPPVGSDYDMVRYFIHHTPTRKISARTRGQRIRRPPERHYSICDEQKTRGAPTEKNTASAPTRERLHQKVMAGECRMVNELRFLWRVKTVMEPSESTRTTRELSRWQIIDSAARGRSTWTFKHHIVHGPVEGGVVCADHVRLEEQHADIHKEIPSELAERQVNSNVLISARLVSPSAVRFFAQ